MKTLIFTVVLFTLIFGAGYLLLKFFSRLSGVDTFAAISWAFKAKRYLIVLPLFPLFFMGLFFT
jgi:hypothetical protein